MLLLKINPRPACAVPEKKNEFGKRKKCKRIANMLLNAFPLY